MKEESLDQHLARIVGNTRRKRRIISIPSLARSIRQAISLLGGIAEVSDRVTLSAKMLRQFLAVQDLHPQVQEMFENRMLDSVDLCSQLATLEPDDQVILADRVRSGSLKTKDVRDYRELKKRNKSIDSEELIKRVIASKPSVEFLAEFILRSGDTLDSLQERFEKHLDKEDILRISIDGAIVSLALSPIARDRLRDLGRSTGFTLEQTIQLVASGKL